MPKEFAHLVTWYRELRAANTRGWAFEPVPYSEIVAYNALYHLNVTPFEVDMLRMLDGVWMKVQPKPKGGK